MVALARTLAVTYLQSVRITLGAVHGDTQVPGYRPTPDTVPPVSVSDLVLSPSQWSTHIVGRICKWIDLDSEDEKLRLDLDSKDEKLQLDSELKLKQEIASASISPCRYLKSRNSLG